MPLSKQKNHPYATMVVGEGGMKVEDFLSINPAKLFE